MGRHDVAKYLLDDMYAVGQEADADQCPEERAVEDLLGRERKQRGEELLMRIIEDSQ